MSKLVSIIIPTYNRAILLMQTIESILNQTYQNFEIIVISDGSTDNTRELIQQIRDERLKFVALESNVGLPAVVRNIGIKLAKGHYIAFCDDDDIWFSNKLEIQVDILDKNSQIGLVCSPCLFLNYDGSITKRRSIMSVFKHILVNSGFIPPKYLLMGMNFVINSSAIIRNDITNLGLLSENKDIKGSEDFDYWLRISNKYQIKYYSSPLLYYRIHDSQLISVGNKGKKTFLKIIEQSKRNYLQTLIFRSRQLMFKLFGL